MTDQLPAIIEPIAPPAPATPAGTYIVPALITDAGGDQAAWRYVATSGCFSRWPSSNVSTSANPLDPSGDQGSVDRQDHGRIVPDDAEIAEQTRRPRCESEQSLCQCDLWHERDVSA